MQGIAQFLKVSRARFEADWRETLPEISTDWEAVKLPVRATSGSAGYDFFAPLDIDLEPGASINVPTGVRARMDSGWVLMLFPRSGLGFKYRLMLNNTVGVVDSDYFDAENEGHIFIKLYNAGDRRISIQAGEAFAQGIFLPFGLTCDDCAKGVRVGGFGSTGGMLEDE